MKGSLKKLQIIRQIDRALMLPTTIGFSKKRKAVEQQGLRVIELELFPPTARHYPRFDYEQICRELEIASPSQQEETMRDDEFRDRDAEEIVRRLEAKYGKASIPMSSSAAPKKAKSKKLHKFAPEDVIDKGLGYNREDDFIDDTEAYDEWVPTTMDTAKRGHYVNKGPLEFRQLSVSTSSSSSSSENESEESSQTGEDQSSSSSSSDEDEREEEDLEQAEANPAKKKEKMGEAAVNKEKEADEAAQQSDPEIIYLASTEAPTGLEQQKEEEKLN